MDDVLLLEVSGSGPSWPPQSLSVSTLMPVFESSCTGYRHSNTGWLSKYLTSRLALASVTPVGALTSLLTAFKAYSTSGRSCPTYCSNPAAEYMKAFPSLSSASLSLRLPPVPLDPGVACPFAPFSPNISTKFSTWRGSALK
eukprot:1169626-Amphidinium_carterae.1